MTFAATVLRVMIASPSDVADARDAVERAVHGWNDANAEGKGVVLLPWRWETSAVPVMGDHPQALINSQGLAKADLVIGLFGSRLGSPTPDEVSGTVEEIRKAVAGGKPVHLYFSTEPLPRDVDTAQLEGLRAFRQEIQDQGLLGEFGNVSQLEHEVWKAIELDIPQIAPGGVESTKSGRVKFLAQSQQERETTFNSKGVPGNRTRRWIEVTNVGTEDALDVIFEKVGDSGMFMFAPEEPVVIHAGQSRRLPVEYSFGGSGEPKLQISWTEGGERHDATFYVG